MMNFRNVCGFLILAFIIFSCKKSRETTDLTREALIPIPASIESTEGIFEITRSTEIYIDAGDAELKHIGEYIASKLRPATGFPLRVTDSKEHPGKGISLTLVDADETLGDEGYELNITEDQIKLTAPSHAGIFRGVQTLRQLLRYHIELSTSQKGPWEIATGTIRDYPTYPLRSAMLDVARHFFTVEEVKQYIDLIAEYKMNALHLHLTDDQGWRIEIKSWPNLTAHGGSTQVKGGKGGFYSQDEYKELVQYANDRYIIIIPEIDMPGHTNAALASYPELNCDGKAPELYTGTEVGFSSLCVDKDVTYKFVEDVVREVASITPGPYFHLGGDESHATKKSDFVKFVNQSQEIVIKYGKKPIGWEEISQGKLQKGTVVQFWSSPEHARNATKQGARLIMSPANKAYLDMSYDSTITLGQHWAAYIEVDSAYMWDPASIVPGISQDNILGIEAPLWTETLSTMKDVEYMAFPRIIGHAEIGWSPASARDWDSYKRRLAQHGTRLEARGVYFYKSKLVSWAD